MKSSVVLGQLVLLVLCHVATGRKTKYKDVEEAGGCGLPSLPLGTRFHRNKEGDRIYFECDNGFKTLGAVYTTCEGGVWSDPPPLCIARRCPITYSLHHGRVTLSYSGAMVRYTCDAPYQADGPTILVCNGRTWNGTVPTCVDPYDRGSRTAASKSSSYKTHSDWLSESDYSCVKRKDSVRPPKIENTHSLTKWSVVEGKPRLYTLYRCSWGYVARGESKYLYCQHGEWIGSPPKCIETMSTPKPSLPRDESYKRTLNHKGWLELADYTCIGTATDPRRLAPDPVPNGNYLLKYAMVDNRPRLYASLRCFHGYKLGTVQNVYCKNKTWLGQVPSCRVDYQVPPRHSISCNYDNGGCQHICVHGNQGATCQCREGYQLDTDGHSCVDFDECSKNNGGCEQICRNKDGSFVCYCQMGYTLAANQKSCYKAEGTDVGDMIPPMALFHT